MHGFADKAELWVDWRKSRIKQRWCHGWDVFTAVIIQGSWLERNARVLSATEHGEVNVVHRVKNWLKDCYQVLKIQKPARGCWSNLKTKADS